MSLDAGLIHRIADRILNDGRRPDAELIGEQIGWPANDPALKEALEEWWQSIAGRVVVLEKTGETVPDSFNRAIKMLWQDAVREATRQVNSERQTLDESLASIRRDSESAMSGSRADYDTLEHRFQLEAARADDAEGQLRLLEAELSVLKSNLHGEVVQRKQYEGKITDFKNDARRSEKQIEDARRLFDQRLKEEQSHCHEQVAKADAETAHLRRTLEQAREESGKKDAVLTRNLHDLQTEIVKRDVKLETQLGQLKNLEMELKVLRSEHAAQRREITKLTGGLLSESNKNKRSEELLRKLQTDLKAEQQKLLQLNAENNRKETDLRNQIKTRDDDLLRTRAQLSSVQKKLLTQEEVIRRLTQQAGV